MEDRSVINVITFLLPRLAALIELKTQIRKPTALAVTIVHAYGPELVLFGEG